MIKLICLGINNKYKKNFFTHKLKSFINKTYYSIMYYLPIYTILAIYVYYMLNYFETKFNFAHPLSNFESNYLYHPIEDIKFPQNLICQFGKDMSILFVTYLIIRGYLLDFSPIEKINIINKYIVIFVFVLSLANFNALVYLMPYFIYELLNK